jgi:hypothetical protein
VKIQELEGELLFLPTGADVEGPVLIVKGGRTYRIESAEYRDGAVRLTMGEEDESWL